MEIKAAKVMDKHHKAILAMDKLLSLHMDRTIAATPVMDKANQVIHSPTVVMRIKSRAHTASNLIITRDSKTWNHQEAKVEEHLHMTSQTMVNKIHMTSSQAMINIKALMMSSQITISSMIPIIKTSSPTIHKGKITATTHKVTGIMDPDQMLIQNLIIQITTQSLYKDLGRVCLQIKLGSSLNK